MIRRPVYAKGRTPIERARCANRAPSFLVRWSLTSVLLLTMSVAWAIEPSHAFHVRAGDAAATLAEFARQSGEQIIYLVDSVRGERTAAIDGSMPTAEAMQRLLGGTDLTVHRDPTTGAMIVTRHSAERVAHAGPAKPEAPAAADEIVKLPQFTVSTQLLDPYRAPDAVSAVRVRSELLDTPSSISAVTREAMDDLAPQRIFDATRYVAGIEEGRGLQFSDRQIIRGFESNGRTVDNFFQTGADNVDEAVIEQIEISKGPNAILAPAGVPGGSINVITKSPSFRPHRQASLQIGSFDAQKATLDLDGVVASRFAYRLIAAAQDTRQYWADDARTRGKVLAPMLTWKPSADTQLTFKAIAAEHWIFREPGLILDPSVGPSSTPQLAPGFAYRSRNGIQPWSHVGTHTVDAFVLLTSNVTSDVAVRLAANARYLLEDSTQEFFSTPTLLNRYDVYTGGLTQDYVWSRNDATGQYAPSFSPYFDPAAIPVRADTQKTENTVVNVQGDVASRRAIGLFFLESGAGFALSHLDSIGRVRTGTLPLLNLAQPDLLFDPLWAPTWYGDLRSKQTTAAWYANERASVFSGRIQVSGGLLRYDVFARSNDHVVSPTQVSILEDHRWLGFGSVLAKPWRNASVYFTHSSNSTPVIANNLPLWRDGVQDEIGAKAEFYGGRLLFTAARFKIRQSNVTVPNPEHQTNPAAPEQLISDLRDDGAEFELTGGLTQNVSVMASYARLWLHDSLGRPVRAVAGENAALLLGYHRRIGAGMKWALFAGGTRAGSRAGDATPTNFTPLGVPTRQSFTIPPFTTFAIGGSFRWRNVSLQVNVDNPFDWTDRLQQGGGRVSGTGLTTSTGRNLRLTTTVEF